MKCQICGKNEVSFQYTSNVNGCVTKMELCADCAAKSGYDIDKIFDLDNGYDFGVPGAFKNLMPKLVSGKFFTPVVMPASAFILPIKALAEPESKPDGRNMGEQCSCCNSIENPAVDSEMAERRELYVKMRMAADKEDYEMAAKLRDELKSMEEKGAE